MIGNNILYFIIIPQRKYDLEFHGNPHPHEIQSLIFSEKYKNIKMSSAAVAICTLRANMYSFFFSAVLLIGEPTRWESHLQLLVDLLLTEGVPKSGHTPKSVKEVKQLPVIACNMDLVFMHQACMPRFGHGAFLVCLEALYKVGLNLFTSNFIKV